MHSSRMTADPSQLTYFGPPEILTIPLQPLTILLFKFNNIYIYKILTDYSKDGIFAW